MTLLLLLGGSIGGFTPSATWVMGIVRPVTVFAQSMLGSEQ